MTRRSPGAKVQNLGVRCAGLLLTDGRSARMGTDKAAIREMPGTGDSPRPTALTLAERTAQLMAQVTEVAIEVGPGYSSLAHVWESPPGSGPLAALAAGGSELELRGWTGPVMVVATDLPSLTVGMLEWLAAHEPGRSVVPVAKGRMQPLCARYEQNDVRLARRLTEAGKRAMFDLIEASAPLGVAEETWIPFAGDPRCLGDADTPEQLDAHPGAFA